MKLTPRDIAENQMGTAEQAQDVQQLPSIMELARYGAKVGLEAIFHRGDDALDVPDPNTDPVKLANWADAGYHFANRIVKATLGTSEATAEAEALPLPYEETTETVKIGKTTHAYTLRRPKEADDTGRVLYILNGLTASQEVYHELARQLTLRGVTTVVSQEVRGVSPNTDKRQYTASEDIASQGAYGVMKDIRKKLGDKKFVLVGHSLGGATGTNAATHIPEWVEHIIHLESTGVDDHNILDMILRTYKFIKGELVPAFPELVTRKNGLQLAVETVKRTALRPARLAVEAITTGRTNLRPRMESLKKSAPHLGWVAIQGESSLFFPILKVRDDGADLYDSFKKHPRPDANHLFPLLFPVSTAVTILEALEEVDRLKNGPAQAPADPELIAA